MNLKILSITPWELLQKKMTWEQLKSMHNTNAELKKRYIDYKLNLRKETQHFIIYYTEIDKKCIDEVCDILETNDSIMY